MAANTPSKSASSQDANPSKAASIYLPDVMCESIEIRVAKTTMFRVHENVLRQSPFFVNALKPEWVSAREGKPIELEDEEPDTFAAYVQWLYSHQVDPEYNQTKWAKNYVLGEKMMDLEFQDSVLDTMIQTCVGLKKVPCGPSTVSIIYNGTQVGSPARKLLIDFWCYSPHKPELPKYQYTKCAPAKFVEDLLLGFSAARFKDLTGTKPYVDDKASYMVGSRKKKG